MDRRILFHLYASCSPLLRIVAFGFAGMGIARNKWGDRAAVGSTRLSCTILHQGLFAASLLRVFLFPRLCPRVRAFTDT